MIIIDVDGCISNDQHRMAAIEWNESDPVKRYDLYHMLSITDQPGNLHVLEGVLPVDIIVLTAMPERYRKLREVWFMTHRIRYSIMLMRADDDHSPSEKLKLKMIDFMVDEWGFNLNSITAAYDDKQ